MNFEPYWVMHVPVISTAHMPGTMALRLLAERGTPCAIITDENGFVYLPYDPFEDAMWTVPIRAWLKKHFGDDADWVRFDCDADTIDGLPTFDWSET